MGWILDMTNSIIISLIPVILVAAFKWFSHKFDTIGKKFEAQGVGIQCVLRNSLMEKMKQANLDGCADEHLREDVTDMYTAYSELNGNGMIKGMYAEFVKLPFPKENK